MPGRDQGDVPGEVSFINTQLCERYRVKVKVLGKPQVLSLEHHKVFHLSFS